MAEENFKPENLDITLTIKLGDLDRMLSHMVQLPMAQIEQFVNLIRMQALPQMQAAGVAVAAQQAEGVPADPTEE